MSAQKASKSDTYTFDISLSVLNHLGRNLYRNFITILGEAISNSWDASATNVWININQENSTLIIKDDGVGMDSRGFQERFLKIGYSKRSDPGAHNNTKRPFIGRKGIGKLALLSCSETVSIASKVLGGEYVGGTIHNPSLDRAISKDISSDKYMLDSLDITPFKSYTQNHQQGTIIYFSNLKEGISNSIEQIKKQVALYFRFSLLDPTFTIFINDEEIGVKNLEDLIRSTEFLWEINSNDDPFINALRTKVIEQRPLLQLPDVHGFVASVEKPSNLKIYGTGGEKIGIDLFVNGRLRETNIMSHIPSARIPESYIYGQIHYDGLDGDDEDRFNSSRESIKADDELFSAMLEHIKSILLGKNGIFDQWDELRLRNKKDGDDENSRKSKRERASAKLFNETIKEFTNTDNQDVKSEIDRWSDELSADAQHNIDAYADCFVSENIVRKFIKYMDNPDIERHRKEINKWRSIETNGKRRGNLSIDIRVDEDDLYYLDIEHLSLIAQPPIPGDGYPDRLIDDEKQFTPIRNAVMHTSLLTPEAKIKLRTVRDNIKAKIKGLLVNKQNS